MTLKGDLIIPVAFASSGACPAISTEFSSLNRYVGQNLVESHYSCARHLSLCREFQETAMILIGGVEYRATLDLIIEGYDYKISKASRLTSRSSRRAF
jgi:hypothetical protein